MPDTTPPGVYLIVEFDWPQEFKPEHGKAAHALHRAVQGQTWIREVVAASGGIGGRLGSVWIFWLENYAAFDRLMSAQDDEVSKAYHGFFNQMPALESYTRGEVVFK